MLTFDDPAEQHPNNGLSLHPPYSDAAAAARLIIAWQHAQVACLQLPPSRDSAIKPWRPPAAA